MAERGSAAFEMGLRRTRLSALSCTTGLGPGSNGDRLDRCTTRPMPNGTPLPDEIALTRQEATEVLFALDAAMEGVQAMPELYARLESAAGIIVEKFLPDLPDL